MQLLSYCTLSHLIVRIPYTIPLLFFFNDTPTTEIYTLSLHDALPISGEVYVINNDTLNWMTVWDRNARGNVKPTRKLHTPMATFGIAADEENQQLLLTVQDDHAVVTFKKNAKELEGPMRLLQGPRTGRAVPPGS